MNWADKVKEYRVKMLLSQKELATVLHVGVASVARWENGYYEPTIKVKRKIKVLLKEANIEDE